MAKTKEHKDPVTYEVGVKGRKPFTVRADKWTNAYDSELRFTLNGEVVFAVHRQKWEYVRRIENDEAADD